MPVHRLAHIALNRSTRRLALLLGSALLLSACQLLPQHHAPDAHTAENALDWAGTYQGLLPCDDCPGIAMAVQLRADKSVVIREREVGGPMRTTLKGFMHFDPAHPSIVIMTDPLLPPAARRFFVGEGWIELREPDTGAPLDAEHPEQYRLRKSSMTQP